ncbi:hypothetical protein [Scatolibacter rhodanostii]|uniref:hypothetical protein n=1 Tax=Scatolibacter rhodanostii TaxID=2014781 RepID=UPI000C07A78D|nr:hypothetical protein [Scatolibacter rhodanostii]
MYDKNHTSARFFLTAAFVSLLALSACGNNSAVLSSSSAHTEGLSKQESRFQEESFATDSSDLTVMNSTVDTVSSQLQQAQHVIPYPLFSTTLNAEQVNLLVENYVTKMENLYVAENVSLENVTYEIMFQNEKYISLYYTGTITSPDLPYPSVFKTTLNIDINTGTAIGLNQIASIDEAFLALLAEKLEKQFQVMGINLSDVTSIDQLKSQLQLADINGDYFSDIQSYFTADEVGIILSVPHVLGDYITVTLPNTSIQNLIL